MSHRCQCRTQGGPPGGGWCDRPKFVFPPFLQTFLQPFLTCFPVGSDADPESHAPLHTVAHHPYPDTRSRSRTNKAAAPPREYAVYLADTGDFQGLADTHCDAAAGHIAAQVGRVRAWNGALGAVAADSVAGGASSLMF